jgi:hypothetical protein
MPSFILIQSSTNSLAATSSFAIPLLRIVPCLLGVMSIHVTHGYHRSPCNKVSVKRQFQFSDCYAPNLNPELSINSASFVMAHDAATGYLNTNAQHSKTSGNSNAVGGGVDDDNMYSNEFNGVDNMNNADNYYSENTASTSGSSQLNAIAKIRLLSLYGKTQVGSVYTQLNDGARALDLRPKIYTNGTIGFHHGSLIDVPLSSITLGGLLQDAKKWCRDNPNELVLIFHSELVHEMGYDGLSSLVAGNVHSDDTNVNIDDDANDEQDQYDYYFSGIARLKEIYAKHAVPYHPCSKLSGLTVGETMTLADLSIASGGSEKGYLLAVDRHDMYGKQVCLYISLQYRRRYHIDVHISQLLLSPRQHHFVVKPIGPKIN